MPGDGGPSAGGQAVSTSRSAAAWAGEPFQGVGRCGHGGRGWRKSGVHPSTWAGVPAADRPPADCPLPTGFWYSGRSTAGLGSASAARSALGPRAVEDLVLALVGGPAVGFSHGGVETVVQFAIASGCPRGPGRRSVSPWGRGNIQPVIPGLARDNLNCLNFSTLYIPVGRNRVLGPAAACSERPGCSLSRMRLLRLPWRREGKFSNARLDVPGCWPRIAHGEVPSEHELLLNTPR